MVLQWAGEGAGEGWVCNVIVRGPDAAAGDDEIVLGDEAARGFDNLCLVIWNDFNAFAKIRRLHCKHTAILEVITHSSTPC